MRIIVKDIHTQQREQSLTRAAASVASVALPDTEVGLARPACALAAPRTTLPLEHLATGLKRKVAGCPTRTSATTGPLRGSALTWGTSTPAACSTTTAVDLPLDGGAVVDGRITDVDRPAEEGAATAARSTPANPAHPPPQCNLGTPGLLGQTPALTRLVMGKNPDREKPRTWPQIDQPCGDTATLLPHKQGPPLMRCRWVVWRAGCGVEGPSP